jgi:hypothetical protein
MFEPNLRDERFLPFEGAGAESKWKLDLPADFRQFDYDTISDVILHVRYTARQGVEPTKVRGYLSSLFVDDNPIFAVLLSLRHDFPNEWASFVNSVDPAASFTATIRKDYFPYFTQGKRITINNLDLYDGADTSKHHAIGTLDANSASDGLFGHGSAFTLIAGVDAAGPTQVLVRNANAEVFLIIRYSLA